MDPVKILIDEHNLISRMRDVLEQELNRIEEHATVELNILNKAIDFVKTYADKCHHGKEERYLFKQMKKKNLKKEDAEMLSQLEKEHIYERNLVTRLVNAGEEYFRGFTNEVDNVYECLEMLVNFFPVHIEHEEEDFFVRSMDYFSGEEKADLVKKFYEHDRRLIHSKYREILEELEAKQ
ncbi:MAG: hemerythrin domain-containing protein [Candidatus Humimicrobiaceae bacterium]